MWLLPSDQDQVSGFTMLECVVAILIINLTIVGMFNLLKGQEQRVIEVEKWLKDDLVLFVNPDPEPLARILGKPASLDPAPQPTFETAQATPYEVRVLEVQRELSPASLAVLFEVYRPAEAKQAEIAVQSDKPETEGRKGRSQGAGTQAKNLDRRNGWKSDKEFKTESTHLRIHDKPKKRKPRDQ
jgi:hypothetical protein